MGLINEMQKLSTDEILVLKNECTTELDRRLVKTKKEVQTTKEAAAPLGKNL